MSARCRRLWVCGALAALTIVAYAQVTSCDLIPLDDPGFVSDNPHVKGGLTLDNVSWAFTTRHLGYWHPLTWLSLQFDATLFGAEQKWGYHLTNLAMHVANVLLVLLVLHRLTGAFWRSALVAALFAVHPQHVESVAWVTERKDVLSLLLGLAALWAYAFYAQRPAPGRYLLVLFFLAAGLMAKAMLVTLPCIFLLLDFWPLGRLQLVRRRSYRLEIIGRERIWPILLEKVPLLLLAIGSSAVTLLSFGDLHSFTVIPASVRLCNAFNAYLTYLEKTVWPVDLAIYYPFPPGGGSPWRAGLAAGLLIFITLVLARSRAYLLVGWFWFLGALVPVLGIVQAGLPVEMADRFVYLPHIGLFVTIVWGLADWAANWRVPVRLQIAMSLLTLGVLAGLTRHQVGYWQDRVTLLSHTLELTQDNALVNRLLGITYLSRQDPDRATYYLRESLRLEPDEPAANLAYAQILATRGQIEEAIRRYRYVADLHGVPSTQKGRAQYLLGIHLVQTGHPHEGRRYLRAYLKNPMTTAEMSYFAGVALLELGDRAGALSRWHEALRLEPDYPEANFQCGRMLLTEGHTEVALTYLTRAATGRQHAGLAVVYDLRGLALARLGRWQEARTSAERAVALDPTLLSARADLAYISEHLGEGESAAKEYEQILKALPDWPSRAIQQALARLSPANSQERDVARAMELAVEACQASRFRDARCLDALAVAYAACGRFADAVRTSQQALALLPEPGLQQKLKHQIVDFQQRRALQQN